MILNKEETLFCKRLTELSQFAYQKNLCYYTDFLNLNELNLFYQTKQTFAPTLTKIWGGFEDAERVMVCFYTNSSFQKPEFPIEVIRVQSSNQKFCDALTHRDYLGAILNLGIERSKIGDILVEETGAYLFCNKTICSFILDYLTKIKHTNIKCSIVSFQNQQFEPNLQKISGTISSIRLDAILSVAYQSSRTGLTSLISNGKVFVNGRMVESNSYSLKEGDIVSTRGYGRFRYEGINHQTKKGRYSITIMKYI